MAPTRKMLFCFALCFCLLNSAFSMPQPFAPEEEEEDNEIKFDDAPEEIPEDELLADNGEPEESEGSAGGKELDDEDEEAEEEKEMEAEEEAEKDLEEEEIAEKELEEESKEEEIAEKELEEEAKEDEEKDLEGADKEDEAAEEDIDSKNEFFKNEFGIILPGTEDKEEIPVEESFNKDEEEMDSEEGGEPVGGFDEEENVKPGFIHRAYKKIKDFFHGLGK